MLVENCFSSVLTKDTYLNTYIYTYVCVSFSCRTHAELLIYDWSNYGDVEVVVEDIERIDFDSFDKYDPKMKDWRMPNEWAWNTARIR